MGDLPNVAATLQGAADLIEQTGNVQASARADWEASTAAARAQLADADDCLDPWTSIDGIRDSWPVDFDPFEGRFRFLAVTLSVQVG